MPYIKPVVPDTRLIRPEWAYQFIGLFAGEGYATIHPTNKGTYHARLGLTLRQDDSLAIYDIQAKLGGRVRLDIHGVNPQLRWEENSFECCNEICRFMLEHWIMPTKKLRDVKAVHQFVLWRLSQPYHKPDWSIAKSYMDDLRESRIFKVPDNG